MQLGVSATVGVSAMVTLSTWRLAFVMAACFAAGFIVNVLLTPLEPKRVTTVTGQTGSVASGVVPTESNGPLNKSAPGGNADGKVVPGSNPSGYPSTVPK